MESGSQSAFHNSAYYLRALKKYLTYLGCLDFDATQELLSEVEARLFDQDNAANRIDGASRIHADLSNTNVIVLNPQSRKRFVIVAIFLALSAVVLISWIQGWPRGDTTLGISSPDSAQSTILVATKEPTVASAQEPAVKAPTANVSQSTTPQIQAPASSSPAPAPTTANIEPPVKIATPSATLKLSFSASSWVRSTTNDGKQTEKIFTPQDSVELDLKNIDSLVIGNAPATHLTFDEKDITLESFINANSGVARLNAADLNKLIAH
jgi:cytoskeletal protein RodZ